MPHLMESMERHDHLALDPEERDRLLAASAATLDRLLTPVRPTVGSRADAGVNGRWTSVFRHAPATTGTDRRQAI